MENQLGSIDILDGKIEENFGFQIGNLFEISGYIKGLCGTGCLYTNDGVLNFIIEGTIGKEDAPSEYKINISGLIS